MWRHFRYSVEKLQKHNNDDNGMSLTKTQYEKHSKLHGMLLHYLYTMADGLVIYAKARAFKAKAGQSQLGQSREIWP